MFKLEALDARHGDCLLLHYGTERDPKLILVDGGPSRVYRNRLRPRLLELREQRSPQGSLPISLAVLSHVDDDHVRGLLDLTEELGELLEQQKPRFVEIERFWFNAFSSIGGRAEGSSVADDDPVQGAVLASIKQGGRLAGNVERLFIEKNAEVSGEQVLGVQSITGFDDLKLHVIGPLEEQLERLRREWDKVLGGAGVAGYDDNSVANLSSIVLWLEFGGKRMLLTGDARGDYTLKGLERLFDVGGDATFPVDLLKVPHHGSVRDVDEDYFRRIPADHYVFSADGTHHNPDLQTLELLAKARMGEAYRIHFTNPKKQPEEDAELRVLLNRIAADNPRMRYRFRDPEGPSIIVEL